MKILILSDNEDPYLWDYYTKGRLDEYDLILSAGDLKAEYLSFLVIIVTDNSCNNIYNLHILYFHISFLLFMHQLNTVAI